MSDFHAILRDVAAEEHPLWLDRDLTWRASERLGPPTKMKPEDALARCEAINRFVEERIFDILDRALLPDKRRGVAGDACGPGNACGRLGCPECQA